MKDNIEKDNIDYLPIWKKNATPEEKFMELALIARKHPERFDKLVVIWQEAIDESTRTDYTSNRDLTTTLGLLELGKFEMLKVGYRLLQE